MKKIISVIMVLILFTVAVAAEEQFDQDFDNFEDESGSMEDFKDNGEFSDKEEFEGHKFEDKYNPESELEDDNNVYDQELNNALEEDIYEGVDDVELQGSAGLTPESSFYFLETLVETIMVGDNPETALEYKEEKVLELKEMIDSGNSEGAEKALEMVEKYNDIIKREVTPDIEKEVRESSKAVKGILNSFESELENEEWDDVREIVGENIKEEDSIALAAKISKQIEMLCKTLSDLDPLEYSKICKTDDDAPKWKKDLDRELTAEQEKEAREFFGIMSQCFENPSECRCEDISVKPFAEKCGEFAPLAAKCESGDEEACQMMEEIGDPIDLLPDYLQDVMEDIEDDYGNAKHDLHTPKECVEAGATSREDCMRVMFKVNAPPECFEALESGKIDPKNENEARKACEAIMFQAEAPQECIDAGLSDFRECERFMFKLDAPKECIDAGLTGEGRDDRKKCEAIRFRLDAPKECLDAGIDGTQRDDWKKCEAIRFKLDSPQECLDAGLTGEGRDDWKKCNKITFLLDAPEECHQFADDRDPWKSCQPVQFKLDAPQECLDAGLDGTGKRDWDECKKIQFKAEASPECLAAGLDGSGRRDWDECNKIREKTEGQGQKKEDCGPNELHICENGNCYCTSDSNADCGAIDCEQGYHCEYGKCFSDGGGCSDCNAKCPGASSTDCVDDECKCYYDEKQPEKEDEQEESECNDGCQQECGDQNTDCVDGKCVCVGYGPNGPPGSNDGGSDGGSDEGTDSGTDGDDTGNEGSGNEGTESGETPEQPEQPEQPEEPEQEPEVVESEPEPNPEPASEPEPAPEPAGNAITGGAVTGFLEALKGLFN